MEDMDLNIENYNFDEILNLFSLSNDYGVEELKRAKKVVLSLHPDKSGLNKDIFIFYKTCYNLLLEVYEFSKQRGKSHEMIDIDDRLYNYFVKTKHKNFNKEFNDMFDKCYVKSHDDKHGHADILKDSFDETSAKSHIKNVKNSIVKIHEPEEYMSGSSLNIHDFHDSYDSHSNNIKRVYLDETVIPIDESYHKSNPRNINSMDDIRRVRSQAFTPLTETESTKIINERQNSSHLKSKKIAYDMYKRRELHEKKYTENISKYNLIGR